MKIISPDLYDKTIYLGYTNPGESKEGSFEVRLNGIEGAKGKMKVLSTRGGLIEKEFILGKVE